MTEQRINWRDSIPADGAWASIWGNACEIHDNGRTVSTWAGLNPAAVDLLEQVSSWVRQCGYEVDGVMARIETGDDYGLRLLPLEVRDWVVDHNRKRVRVGDSVEVFRVINGPSGGDALGWTGGEPGEVIEVSPSRAEVTVKHTRQGATEIIAGYKVVRVGEPRKA